MTSKGDSAPRVSVVIVSFNHRDLLAAVLECLRRQTFRDFETIVVDNGSGDGSADFVAAHFPEVELERLSTNTGFTGGNNCGIAAARGEYVAFLNNDAEPEPEWLAELVAALDSHPEAGSCASRVVLYSDPHLLDAAGDGLTFAGTAFRRGHRLAAADYSRTEFVFGASGSAALYRRDVLDAVGSFDDAFFAVYEDVDLALRAQLAGWRCLYVPAAAVHHRGSGTIGRYTDFYVYQTQRNVEYVLVKDMPLPLLLLVLPGHVLYNLFGFLYFTLVRRRGRAFVRAKWDALRTLPRLLRQRSRVQSTRRVSTRYLLSLIERGWISRTAREKLAP